MKTKTIYYGEKMEGESAFWKIINQYLLENPNSILFTPIDLKNNPHPITTKLRYTFGLLLMSSLAYCSMYQIQKRVGTHRVVTAHSVCRVVCT